MKHTKATFNAARCALAALAMLCANHALSQNQPPASDEATAKLQKIRDAMVLVAIRINGQVEAVPGMVYHRAGDRALILARPFKKVRTERFSPEGIVSGPRHIVLVGKGKQRVAVECERVTARTRYGLSIFSAPADRLPLPIPVKEVRSPEPGIPVQVIGYESDVSGQPTAYADFAHQGQLQEAVDNRFAKIPSINMQCGDAPTVSLAVVATNSGEVVGLTMGQRPTTATDSSQYTAVYPEVFAKLIEPIVPYLQLGFESGDTKQVVYEFVAVIEDPCGEINEPKLSVQWQPQIGQMIESEAMGTVQSINAKAAEEQPPVDSLPDATTLDLTKRSPSAAFARQYPTINNTGEVGTWVARLPAENPGISALYLFRGQLSYSDPSGKKVYMPVRAIEFTRRHHRGELMPAIPGIDGKPLECPRPVLLEDGTYRVTSDCTRIESQPESDDKSVPQPVESGRELASKVPGAGGRIAVSLEVTPAERLPFQSIPNVPALFSPDGAWLYLIDADSKLRRISTSDFKEPVYLKFDAQCTSIGYARAGLVAAVGENIYVLDPETLQVKRTIPTGGVRTVVASPSADIGFAEGRVEPPRETSKSAQAYSQLLMVDYKSGRQIHRIKYGQGCNLQIGRVSFHQGFGSLYLSKDGKYLYLGGHYSEKKLHRFRVDDSDLIYERTTGAETAFLGEDVLVTQDKFSSNEVRHLEESLKLIFEIPLRKRGPVAIDPESRGAYKIDGDGRLYEFDAKGKQVGMLSIPKYNVSYLLPHPGGKRMLGWGREKVVYYDLDFERLANLARPGKGNPPPVDNPVAVLTATGKIQPLTPGNLLTTTIRKTLLEINPQGEIVQSIEVPKPPQFEQMPPLNDLDVTPDGSISVMLESQRLSSGKYVACVLQLPPDRKEWSVWSFPVQQGHSHGFIGDIELRKNGELAVLFTAGDAFLLDTQAASKMPKPIPSGFCMTFGADGTYYTTAKLKSPRFENGKSIRNDIRAYDLNSLRQTREFGVEEEPASMAVDKDGTIYTARFATVTKISPDARTKQLTVSKSWSSDSIYDIALSPGGKLAMGSRSDKLFIVDRDLNEESLLVCDNEKLAKWVAWIPSEEPSRNESVGE